MKSLLIPVISVFLGCIVMGVQAMPAEDAQELVSPNRKIRVRIEFQDRITYTVFFGSERLTGPNPLSLTLKDYGTLGAAPELKSFTSRTKKDTLYPVVRQKSRTVSDQWNEISLKFAGRFELDFRAYDDGVAYRFRTELPDEIFVTAENVTLNFPRDHKVYFPTEESFLTHSERLYEYLSLSEIPGDTMAHLPVLIDVAGGPKVAFTEAGLEDYAGLYLRGSGGTALKGLFPAVATRENQTRDRTLEVTERADHIAQTKGRRSFPWRVLVIAENDGDLIDSQMVYKLSPENRIKDPSWIRPGKVAWDWWNANNIFGVDFRAGINTETYKYYIDFASRYGIEYIILDEGWSDTSDLFKVNPDIDLEILLAHAQRRNVGVILWVVWKTLDDQLDEALDRFAEWGIKGIKVDFMQRDDQWMVNYYWRIAEAAAQRKLLVDFHGSYKPTGLRRAYPNVLTREGVRGLEHVKWSKHPTPEHNVTLPFIRMLAGPMDYTPGAMINAQEKTFNAVFTRPMSLGTRCHQLAMYVVFESPLQMLADSPSHYLREKACMDFLAPVPTVWDETRVLDAKVGDYVLIARKSGEEWYLGAMTDWSPRELIVDFSFLPPGDHSMEFFQDGPNADRYGNDFEQGRKTISQDQKIRIRLAPGGGWAARIY
ncbi:MAG: glycoside hydrolase family 97 protein [Candidatus Aminicenantaceae bacterium]